MKHSIRRFLLVNLLIAIAVMASMTMLANLILNDHEVEQQLDTQLLQDNSALQAMTDSDNSFDKFHHLRIDINKMPLLMKHFYEMTNKANTYRSPYPKNHIEFQIWSPSHELLLKSPNAPSTDISTAKEGFSNIKVENDHWRIFTTISPKNGNKIVFAERYASRKRVSEHFLKNDLLILLIAYPLFGLLIWFIVGRSLRSLGRVTNALASREFHYLEPVCLDDIPKEVVPLVKELNQLFSRLGDSIEREKRFSADAAHELRTPLAALRTQVQVALKTKEADCLEKALRNIIKAVDRSAHIVDQLLILNRINPETIEKADYKPVNLVDIAAEGISELAPIAYEKKQIDIELINKTDCITVLGNTTALQVLLRNLIYNAILYTPEKSHIYVILTCYHKHVTLQVIDNGPGIDPTLYDRVFERFYRIVGNKSHGSGLGLAIVDQIATLHKGKVILGAPASGTGLVVSVTLPLLIEPFSTITKV